MSQIKKKKMKQPTRLRTLVASLMLIAPAIHAANDTEFSQRPLVGVAASFAPHIALALSVEFPTAGAAYSEHHVVSLKGENVLFGRDRIPSYSMTQPYLGYFDNTKCYIYNHTGGYFEPNSMAENVDGYYGLCNKNDEDKEEFSGNLMNAMTMTAVDIFRSAMTGGNRAFGTGTAPADYQKGDTTTETYLRRAKVDIQKLTNPNRSWSFIGNGMPAFRITDRQLAGLNANQKYLKRLLPHYFVDVLLKEEVAGTATESTAIIENFGRPKTLGFRAIEADGTVARGSVIASLKAHGQTVTQYANQPAGQYDIFTDSHLHFYNNNFTVHLVRKVSKVVQYRVSSGPHAGATAYQVAQHAREGLLRNDTGIDYANYYVVMDEKNSANVDAKYRNSIAKWSKPLNVVVKVCDTSKGLDKEENCKPYGSNYKPEGLLQEYTQSSGMRFATFGYLNINNASNAVDGGVLRSRMKTLIGDKKLPGESYTTVYGDEWNTNTGILNPNPDTTDARSSGVTNSGTINYLNKFGDRSGYKNYDPAGELYETALTYLRGQSAIYKKSSLTDDAKDGFPAIYDWDDPYKRGIDPKVQHCHANSIIFIGDTNTHDEAGIIQANPEAKDYTDRLFENEDDLKNVAVRTNMGSNKDNDAEYPEYSPAYMAGLAYWARTNNIRSDLTQNKEGAKPINSSNFIIDVLEKGDAKAKPMRNVYYLAAKYGGFTLDESSLVNDLNGTDRSRKPLPKTRGSWTDDAVGAPSINQFADGVPRNFAIANNPKAMKAALDKAFATSAALNNPSQAATGLSIGLGEILDVSEDGSNHLLQSTYDFAKLTGDVVVYKPEFVEVINDKTKTVERNFKLKELARTGSILTTSYHGTDSKYDNRKVFTIKNNTAYEFAPKHASTIFSKGVGESGAPNAEALLKYILGDSTLEGTLRTRTSLQGTVINSTATPIFAAKNIKDCAPFDDTAKGRSTYYAAAANDGMLHIFDDKGHEKMAYMAGTALDKLPEFAKVGFQHQYLNDGTPVIQDMCLNNKPTTVLLGTTGRGGKAVYALDVTNISTPSTDNIMWEFTHDDLGLTVSKPVFTKGKDGKQYAIVSSGYNSDSSQGYIFVLDINKNKTGDWVEGRDYWKIQLGKSGVGAPFVFDSENDGVGDKIFVGDLEGQIWQLNRSESGSVPFELKYGAPLFKPNSTFARPITGAPFADMVNGKLMVTVGTGRYFSENDLSTTQQNYAYGLIVDDKTPIPDDSTNILEQYFETEKVENKLKNANVYAVSERKMDDKHRGWRLTLVQGMNIASPSLIRQRQVSHFVFARNTGEINSVCVRGANAGIIEVDVKTGGLFSKPLIDTDGDGQFTEKDARNAAAVEFIGMNTSVGTFLQYHNPNSKINISAVYFNDGSKFGEEGGGPRLVDLRDLSESQAGVRRISWREIF